MRIILKWNLRAVEFVRIRGGPECRRIMPSSEFYNCLCVFNLRSAVRVWFCTRVQDRCAVAGACERIGSNKS
jgi:hypothetical protein